jgi:hypothetical protein
MKLSPIGFCGLLSGAILGLAPAAHACSCGAVDTPFVQTVPDAAVVIRGTVLADQWSPSAMTVEVSELLKGKLQAKQLTLRGSAGLLCRPDISNFPVGSEWVFALSRDSWSNKGALEISSCGQYTLPVQGDTVKGRITQSANQAESLSLPNLRELVKNPPQKRKRAIAPPSAPKKCPTRP